MHAYLGHKRPLRHLSVFGHISSAVCVCVLFVQSTAGLLVKVTTEQEALLVASSTSLFVAAAEAVLSHKLEGIHRKPASTEERVANCDAVVGGSTSFVLRPALSGLEHKFYSNFSFV